MAHNGLANERMGRLLGNLFAQAAIETARASAEAEEFLAEFGPTDEAGVDLESATLDEEKRPCGERSAPRED